MFLGMEFLFLGNLTLVRLEAVARAFWYFFAKKKVRERNALHPKGTSHVSGFLNQTSILLIARFCTLKHIFKNDTYCHLQELMLQAMYRKRYSHVVSNKKRG